MKKTFIAFAMALALPVTGQAQGLQPGGFYIGAEGGANWLLNTSTNATVVVPNGGFASGNVNASTNTGWLGRWLDATHAGPLDAISVGPVLPLAFTGERVQAAATQAYLNKVGG